MDINYMKEYIQCISEVTGHLQKSIITEINKAQDILGPDARISVEIKHVTVEVPYGENRYYEVSVDVIIKQPNC